MAVVQYTFKQTDTHTHTHTHTQNNTKQTIHRATKKFDAPYFCSTRRGLLQVVMNLLWLENTFKCY